MTILFRKSPPPSMLSDASPVPLSHCRDSNARKALIELLTESGARLDRDILIYDRHLRPGIYSRGNILNLAPVFLSEAGNKIRVLTQAPINEEKFFAKHAFARMMQEEHGAEVRFTRWKPTYDFIIRGSGMFFKNPTAGLRGTFNSGKGSFCPRTRGTASSERVERFRGDFEQVWQTAETPALTKE